MPTCSWMSRSQVVNCSFWLVAKLQEGGSYLIWACQRSDARRREEGKERGVWCAAYGLNSLLRPWWSMNDTLIPEVFWCSFCLQFVKPNWTETNGKFRAWAGQTKSQAWAMNEWSNCGKRVELAWARILPCCWQPQASSACNGTAIRLGFN